MSEQVTLNVPAESALTDPAQRMLADAAEIVIDSQEMLQVAADELAKIKRKSAELEAQRKSITAPLDLAKSRMMDLFRRPQGILEQAKEVLEKAIRVYNAEQRRIADKARQDAEEAARKERQRLEDNARRERERAAAEEAELRRRAEEAAAAGKAAEAAKLAARADAKVDAAEARAESLEAVAASMPTNVVVQAAPKATGLSSATLYSAEVQDLAKLVAFVAANPMYLGVLQVNQTALNAQAKALKSAFALPGCRLVETESLRSRAA